MRVCHTKKKNPSNFLLFPEDIFMAINNKCNQNEAKILMTLIGYNGDGSFSPSTAYMLKMTGIKHSNHYFVARKNLEKKGYIHISNDTIYIDIDKILGDE